MARIVMLIVGGLAVLGVAGLAVWWFLIREPSAPKSKEQSVAASTQVPSTKGKAPAAEAKKAPSPAPAAAGPIVPPALALGPKSPYKGFWYEKGLTPERLASIIEGALSRDSAGTKLIDEAKCNRDGSCAAPMNYLEAFRAYDPNSGLTHVSQLPRYIRENLVMDCSSKGRFMMADIYKPSSGPSMGRTETARMSRNIGSAECVFKNRVTGRPVIAQFCANPVGKEVPQPPPPPPPKPPCAAYDQQVQRGDIVIVALVSTNGQKLPKDECEPAIRIAGASTFVSPNSFPDCPRSLGLNCDLSVAASMAGGTVQSQLVYTALADGTTTLVADAVIAEAGSGYAIVTCLVRLGQSSCGVITKPKHYGFERRRAMKVATVYAKGGIPGGLRASHWDQTWRNAEDGCPVRRPVD